MTDRNIRGTCRICGRSVALLIDGRIGRHARKLQAVRPALMCSGWGQMPKEEQQ